MLYHHFTWYVCIALSLNIRMYVTHIYTHVYVYHKLFVQVNEETENPLRKNDRILAINGQKYEQ